MKKFAILAALAVIPTPLLANDTIMHKLGAIPASMDSVQPGTVVLALTVEGEMTAPPPKHRPSSGRVTGGLRQIVMIDGELMQVNEAFLRQQIAAGTLEVVYPGTNTEWQAGAKAPSYPPAWFTAQMNG